MNCPLPLRAMLSIGDYKRLFGDSNLSDEELAEFRENLQIYIGKFLDDYFKDEMYDDYKSQ